MKLNEYGISEYAKNPYLLDALHMTGPLATDEVDDASDELLNEDQNDADLELSEDYDRTTFLDDGVGDLAKANSTQGPPESTNRFFKKKWKSWKKKAKKSWKRARKPWKKGYTV